MEQDGKTYIHIITQDETDKFMITEQTKEGYEVSDPNKNWYYKIKYLGKIRIIKELWIDNTGYNWSYIKEKMPWAAKTIIIWEKWKQANALFKILTKEERTQLQDNK